MENTTLGTLGTKMVNLYVPGAMVRIGGIPDMQAKTGQFVNEYAITRTSVEWVETDSLDIMDGFVQTLTLLAIDANGDDKGFNEIVVKSDLYDIEIV
jgi:hypothetical protein